MKHSVALHFGMTLFYFWEVKKVREYYEWNFKKKILNQLDSIAIYSFKRWHCEQSI